MTNFARPPCFRLGALLAMGLAPPGCRDSKSEPTPDAPHTDEDSAGAPDSDGDTASPITLPDLLQLEAQPRNLLIISIDTLRRSDVGYYGGGELTPALDRLLREGVSLDRHRSCSSWTYPSAICAMVGAQPVSLGFYPNPAAAAAGDEPMPEGTPTLAGTLRDAGWQTALVSSNVYLAAQTGLSEGYDTLDASELWQAIEVTEQALARADLGLDTSQPWVLHAHYIDPHSPYAPPEAYRQGIEDLPPIAWDLDDEEDTAKALAGYDTLSAEDQATLLAHVRLRYEGEVRYVDDQVEALLVGMLDRGLLNDTLVLLWSDHGEQFFEHDSFGHSGTLFAEENEAIAALWSPLLAADTWAFPTTHEDLPPTVLAMLGQPPGEIMTGEIVGSASPDRALLGALLPRDLPPLQSVVVGDRRLIYNWSGHSVLYDLASDPTEQVDLYDETSTEAAAMWEILLPEVVAMDRVIEGWTPVDPGP